MSTPRIDSLAIENYRSLQNVDIERLGRLNLITGRNNVGKTSLLESVRLWAAGTDVSALLEIIDARDESVIPEKDINGDRNKNSGPNSLLGCLFLFSGYPSIKSIKDQITITGGDTTLVISIEDRILKQESLPGFDQDFDNLVPMTKSLELSVGDSKEFTSIRLPNYYSDEIRRRFREQNRIANRDTVPCVSLASRTSGVSEVFNPGLIWDNIALTPKEDIVIDGLKLIEPRIERVVFVQGGRQRIPVVRLSGISRPIPLRGLGDGVLRVFQIMLAMVSAEGGFVLIDDFENGLHYSVQEAAWKTLFELATVFDVQVFATTHSNDCVEAFQQVSEGAADDMVLIRLIRDSGEVRAETLGSEKLALRLDLGQEVR